MIKCRKNVDQLAYLVASLKSNTNLTILDLSNNKIKENGEK